MVKKDAALLLMIESLRLELRANTNATLVTCGRADVVADVLTLTEQADGLAHESFERGDVYPEPTKE